MARSTLVLKGSWNDVCRRVHERAKEMITKYGIKPTLRALFYWAADSEGLIVHSQNAYKKLSEKYARYRERTGEIDVLSDRTREYKRYYSYTAEDMEEWVLWHLEYIVDKLENSIWKLPRWYNQSHYVALWIEKETITLVDLIAQEYEVDAFPSRGFSSVTKLNEAAKVLKTMMLADKKPVILVLTDFDPSGIFIERDYKVKVQKYGASAEFIRIAMYPEQINKYGLPAIPPDDDRAERVRRDSRYRKWLKYCDEHGVKPLVVELDAFAGTRPREFRELIVSWIEKFYDKSKEAEKKKLEEERRKKALELKQKIISITNELQSNKVKS